MKVRTISCIRELTKGSGRIPKVTLLITLAFILKALSGCFDPVWDFDFSFNKITVKNLDNSGIYTMDSNWDTMYAAAVAFEVTLSDETFLASAITRQVEAPLFGFTPASAESPDPRYYPVHRITEVSIVTLEAMSPDIPAGTDVTGFFVAHVPHFTSLDFLYLGADELPPVLDQEFYLHEPSVSFQLFCREEIAGNKAQFVITITLSDESTLSATTSLITLLSNE